jgi:hypothetical protein
MKLETKIEFVITDTYERCLNSPDYLIDLIRWSMRDFTDEDFIIEYKEIITSRRTHETGKI